MTDTNKTIPVWVDNDGTKVQVGWATPDNNGVRSVNLLDEYSNTSLKDIHFGDVDPFETSLDPAETQEPPRTFEEFASEPFVDIEGEVIEPALDESPDFDPAGVTVVTTDAEVVAEEEDLLPSEPIEDAPDEDLAAEPIDAGVAPEDSEPVVEATIEPDEPELGDTEETWDEDSDDAEDVSDDFDSAPAVVEDNYDDHQDH